MKNKYYLPLHISKIQLFLISAILFILITAGCSSRPAVNDPSPLPTSSPIPTPSPIPFDPDVDEEKIEKENLPSIYINTKNQASITNKEEYITSLISVTDKNDTPLLENAQAGVRLRGNSTLLPKKKAYRIKFDSKENLLGLNGGREYKSWCLLAEYYDASFLRNKTCLAMADILLENKYYCSDTAFVKLYINEEYKGMYLLCEQTQINPGRVDIPEKDDQDLTTLETGYLIIGQGDGFTEEEGGVIDIKGTIQDMYGERKYNPIIRFALSGTSGQEQRDYVANYVEKAFLVVINALRFNKYYNLSKDGTLTPKTDFKGETPAQRQIETISEVLDIRAAVRMNILEEIVKNYDSHCFYMYVDLSPEGDGRIVIGPPWDFDLTLGLASPDVHYSTTGFFNTLELSGNDGFRKNVWSVLLSSSDWFLEMTKEVWQRHYPSLLTAAKDIMILSYKYSHFLEQEYEMWGLPKDRSRIHIHTVKDLETFNTPKDAAQYVYTWLLQRLEFLNSQWG